MLAKKRSSCPHMEFNLQYRTPVDSTMVGSQDDKTENRMVSN